MSDDKKFTGDKVNFQFPQELRVSKEFDGLSFEQEVMSRIMTTMLSSKSSHREREIARIWMRRLFIHCGRKMSIIKDPNKRSDMPPYLEQAAGALDGETHKVVVAKGISGGRPFIGVGLDDKRFTAVLNKTEDLPGGGYDD